MPASRRVTRAVSEVLDLAPRRGEVSLPRLVDAVGEGVTGLAHGDRVAALGGRGFAEFALAPADLTIGLPANLTFEQGAALPLNGLTALAHQHESHRAAPSVSGPSPLTPTPYPRFPMTSTMAADMLRPFADRMTPVGIVTMHTPSEAIEEAEYVVRHLGMKAVFIDAIDSRHPV